MLDILSSAHETRHHQNLKSFLGRSAVVKSLTEHQNQTFVLVENSEFSRLVPLYGDDRLAVAVDDSVRLGLGRQLVTQDDRIIYDLVACPLKKDS